MPLKDLPIDAQPREKLLARGPAALSDAELLRQECLYRNRVVVKYPVADALLDPPAPGSDDAQHPQ